MADFYVLFALAGFVTKSSNGQDSDVWSVFELRCLASNTIITESFFFMMIDGVRKFIP